MVETCPRCKTLWLFEEKDGGRTVPCPKCGTAIAVQKRSLAEAESYLNRCQRPPDRRECR